MSDLTSVYSYIENNQDKFVQRLADAVAVKSVSAWYETRSELIKMMEIFANMLENIGANVELVHHDEEHIFIDGRKQQLPPVILASLLTQKTNAKTVLIYGHLDVQPAKMEDGWNTDPFILTNIDGKLFGRGSSDDKGPVLGWLNTIEAFQNTGNELPVNIKFCIEGMEENGSIGLNKIINNRKNDFFNDVDFACISDNNWLGTKKPCITYGVRGVVYFELKVKCADKDLHSGTFGGTVNEAFIDLVHIMSSLVSSDGKINISDIYEQVAPLTNAESSLYESIDFDLEEYKKTIGCSKIINGKSQTLMNRMRNPSLSLHGVEGAFYEPGCKTVIPSCVKGKFSIRTVPYMKNQDVINKVQKYCTEIHSKLNSSTEMSVYPVFHGDYWLGKFEDKNFQAARKAILNVYGVEPDFIREGGSIPIVFDIERATETSVVLIPCGRGDDGAHSQNEKLDLSNYINGTKMFASYLTELGN